MKTAETDPPLRASNLGLEGRKEQNHVTLSKATSMSKMPRVLNSPALH